MLAGVGYFVLGRVMLKAIRLLGLKPKLTLSKRRKLFNNKPADTNSTIVNAVSRITSMPQRFRTRTL